MVYFDNVVFDVRNSYIEAISIRHAPLMDISRSYDQEDHSYNLQFLYHSSYDYIPILMQK